MQVTINSKNTILDEVQVYMSINELTRQFVFVDISNTQNFKKGDKVEIKDDNDVLLIKAEIEYVKVESREDKSEFIYAGRNNAKYIVDSHLHKTIQFSEQQKINGVLSEVASKFGLKVVGDAQLPKDAMKTILIGDDIGRAFLEITKSAGKILTSDAEGNLKIEFEAEEDGDEELEYGKNIRERIYNEDDTIVYDKYIVVSQSNYLINQQQDVDVQGSYGDGKITKVILSEHTLTQEECEKLAEVEYKKDRRKGFLYSVITDLSLEINKKYLVRDDAIHLNEKMNLKRLEIHKSSDKYETRAYFERIIK